MKYELQFSCGVAYETWFWGIPKALGITMLKYWKWQNWTLQQD